MSKQLQEKTQEWMELERKTLEQRKLAEEFYDKNLMRLIKEDFLERNHQKLYEQAEYFIVSVGTSYEPVILNLSLFHPRHVLFLYTKKTEHVLNKIVRYHGMEANSYEKRQVNETNPLDIYREIKRSYLEWHKPGKMYIDFTGGTKAMSAAAAMAGAMINVQLVYVGSDDYLEDFRKPNPGSETLYFINNPLAVFGDLEIEKALALFQEYNYAGAIEKLEVLKENIPDPDTRQQLNFVYLLAKVYEAWDALAFSSAYENIKILNQELARDQMMHSNFLLMDFSERLRQQERILSDLLPISQAVREKRTMDILTEKNTINALMFTMGQNAMIREWQEKYDMATLLLYRLLEMIEQRRLAKYNLFVSRMEYENIRYNVKRMPEFAELKNGERLRLLKEKVSDIKRELFGSAGNGYLPEQVSLLEGFIILLALGDPIVRGEGKSGINKLKRIRAMVFLRNNSIFAHGLGPVGIDDFTKFRKFVLEILEDLCKIEKINSKEYWENISWINPMDSKYHALRTEER